MKKKIEVLQKFVLTLKDGTQHKFEAGVHFVEEHIASHWYVKAHANILDEAEAAVETAKAKVGETFVATGQLVASALVDATIAEAKKPAKK